MERLLRDLEIESLERLDDFYHRTTRRQRRHVSFHGPWPPETELHIWKGGCHTRTIVVRGLPELTLAWLFGKMPWRLPREDTDDARTILASLPGPLSKAIRRMASVKPNSAERVWCESAGSFSRERLLPHQALWYDEPLDARKTARLHHHLREHPPLRARIR
jgi:hypothetical protein